MDSSCLREFTVQDLGKANVQQTDKGEDKVILNKYAVYNNLVDTGLDP